jgi:hypothetical protein
MSSKQNTAKPIKPVKRFHRGGDGWGRSAYSIPTTAVCGSSDTGTWDDSPANSYRVKEELERVRKVLKEARIASRYGSTATGNIFNTKRWVCVGKKDFPRALEIAESWLNENTSSTHHVHNAR